MLDNLKYNIHNFLSFDEISHIKGSIALAERKTSAEIKVLIVNNSRPYGIPRFSDKDKEKDVLKRARKEYLKLGIGNTRDDTGVLIMLSLAEHKVRVLAGSAINDAISQQTWEKMVEVIIEGIRDGENASGICVAVRVIGDLLAFRFPVKPDDQNELSDRVVLKR